MSGVWPDGLDIRGYSRMVSGEVESIAFLIQDIADNFVKVDGEWRQMDAGGWSWALPLQDDGEKMDVHVSGLPGAHQNRLGWYVGDSQPRTSLLYSTGEEYVLHFAATRARVNFAFGEYRERLMQFGYSPHGRIRAMERLMGTSFEQRDLMVVLHERFGHGMTALAALRKHEVPNEYTLAAGDGLSLAQIIECYEAGIPAEYLEAMGG